MGKLMPESESHQSVELVRAEPDEYILEQLQIVFDQVAGSEAAKAAEATWHAARDRVPALVTAQTNLNKLCTRLGNESAEILATLTGRLIDLHAEGGPPDALDALIAQVETLRSRHGAANEALEHCVMHSQPRAGIEEAREHAQWLDVLASGIKRRADERLAQMMAALSGVAEAEGCIAFDPSKTLAGALDRLAREYSMQATALRQQADEAARKYDALIAQVVLGPRRR